MPALGERGYAHTIGQLAETVYAKGHTGPPGKELSGFLTLSPHWSPRFRLPSLTILKQRQRKYGIVLTLSRMHLRSNVFLVDLADDGKGPFRYGDRFGLGLLDWAGPERFPIG